MYPIARKRMFLFFLLLALPSVFGSNVIVRELDDDHFGKAKGKPQLFNFASQAAGAVLLDKSPGSKGYHNLLHDDKDKYGISPCELKKWVVIGLSEEVQITALELLNFEKYSSMLREFQLLASSSYPTDEWINLGIYSALPQLGSQTFHITDLSEAHTRYIKVKFLTHYSNEALCTLSQIKVYGTTVIAAFQQEVERSDTSMRDMLSQLNSEDTTPDYAALLRETVEEGEVLVVSATAENPAALIADTAQSSRTPSKTTIEQDIGRTSATPSVEAEQGQPDSPPSEAAMVAVPQADDAAAAVESAVDTHPASALEESGSSGHEPVITSNERPNDETILQEVLDPTPASDRLPTASTAIAMSGQTSPVDDTPADSVVSIGESAAAGSLPPFTLADKVKKLLPALFSALETEPDDMLQAPLHAVGEGGGTGDKEPGAQPGPPPDEGELPQHSAEDSASRGTAAPGQGTAGPELRNTTRDVALSSQQSIDADEDSNNYNVTDIVDTGRQYEAESSNGSTSGTLNATAPASDVVRGNEHGSGAQHLAPVDYLAVPADAGANYTERNASSEIPALTSGSLSNESTATSTTAASVQVKPATAAVPGINISVGASIPSQSGVVVLPIGGRNLTVNSTSGGLPNMTLNCYETLSFPEFSRKMRAKLQQYSANNSTVTAGAGNNSVQAGNATAEEGQQLGSKERDKDKESNVFKSLMQKIKTLEMNNAIMEMYTIQVLALYYRTLLVSTMVNCFLLLCRSACAVVERVLQDCGEGAPAANTGGFRWPGPAVSPH
jgi:hypothetical protein